MRTALPRRILAVVVTAHGLVHLLGVAQGFGWADVPQLTVRIGPAGGAAWLLAAVLVVTAAVMLAARTARWWVTTAVAAVCSQAVILGAWTDARAGTVPNLLMLVAAVYGFAAEGPRSFRTEYRRRALAALAAVDVRPGAARPDVVTEDDLARLPAPVAAYVRSSGAVGQPRVRGFRAVLGGRIRGGPDEPWMELTGEQVNTFGAAPVRLFHIEARRSGLPVDVLHVFADGTATMRGRLLSLVPFLDTAGPEMNHAETVTVFNDLCLLAPGALVDAPVTWEVTGDDRVTGTFTLGTETVSAELVFDAEHRLVDFVSDDRSRASADGRVLTPMRWSTPVGEYRQFGPARLVATGEGHWHAPEPEGEFAYFEFRLHGIGYDLREIADGIGHRTTRGTTPGSPAAGSPAPGGTARTAPGVPA